MSNYLFHRGYFYVCGVPPHLCHGVCYLKSFTKLPLRLLFTLNELEIVYSCCKFNSFTSDNYDNSEYIVILGEVLVYNVFYEIFTVCTSIVGMDTNGKITIKIL